MKKTRKERLKERNAELEPSRPEKELSPDEKRDLKALIDSYRLLSHEQKPGEKSH